MYEIYREWVVAGEPETSILHEMSKHEEFIHGDAIAAGLEGRASASQVRAHLQWLTAEFPSYFPTHLKNEQKLILKWNDPILRRLVKLVNEVKTLR